MGVRFSEVSTWLRKSKPVGTTVLQDTGFRLVLFFFFFNKKKKKSALEPGMIAMMDVD